MIVVPMAIAAIKKMPPAISQRIGALERNAFRSKEPVPSAVIVAIVAKAAEHWSGTPQANIEIPGRYGGEVRKLG